MWTLLTIHISFLVNLPVFMLILMYNWLVFNVCLSLTLLWRVYIITYSLLDELCHHKHQYHSTQSIIYRNLPGLINPWVGVTVRKSGMEFYFRICSIVMFFMPSTIRHWYRWHVVFCQQKINYWFGMQLQYHV